MQDLPRSEHYGIRDFGALTALEQTMGCHQPLN